MGRLTLSMLLSFAQFEREMVSDRTRDKMCAARDTFPLGHGRVVRVQAEMATAVRC